MLSNIEKYEQTVPEAMHLVSMSRKKRVAFLFDVYRSDAGKLQMLSLPCCRSSTAQCFNCFYFVNVLCAIIAVLVNKI